MLVLYLGNAVLGGISVLVKLAWVSVMGHFLLAIALVAVALMIHKRAGEPDGPRAYVVTPRVRYLARVVYVLTIWVLVLGTLVTAAGPHGGDVEAKRLSWQITDLARVHAISVDVLVAARASLLVVLAVRDRAPRRVLDDGVGRARRDGRAGNPRLRAVRAGHPRAARRLPRRGRGPRVRVGAAGSSSSSACPTPDATSRPHAHARMRGSTATRGAPDAERSSAVRGTGAGRCCARLRALHVHLVDGTYELFRQFLAPRPGHLDADGVEVGGTRAVVQSVIGDARGRRDAPRRRDRPRHRVVPQRPLGRLQERRRHRSAAEGAVPDARGRARARSASRCGRWSTSKPTTRSRRAARGRRGRRPRRAGDHLHARQGPRAVRRRQGRATRPAARDPARRRRRAARSSACRPRRSPTGSRSSATRPTGSPGSRASAPRPRPRCSTATSTSKRSPTTPKAWDVPGVRGVDRLAATLAAGRDVADRFKVLATLRTDADVGTVDDWEWTGRPPSSPHGANASARRGSPSARARSSRPRRGAES